MSDVSLVPVEHQPEFEGVSLVPVEHDPFVGDDATQHAQSPQAQTQPAQSRQVQTQQPAVGVSQSSAPTPGAATTDSTGSALTAGTNDFFRSIPRGIVSGFNSAASALGRATQAEMGQDVDAPTPEQGMQILEREVTGPMHRPEGRAGQFGASVGEFLGNPASYLAPGSLPLKVGSAVLGGLGERSWRPTRRRDPLGRTFTIRRRLARRAWSAQRSQVGSRSTRRADSGARRRRSGHRAWTTSRERATNSL
jgi:hypothetical protein